MRYSRAFTVSFALHLALLFLLAQTPPLLDRPKVSRPPQYVDLLEKPVLNRRPHQSPAHQKQFIRSAPVPPELLTTQPKQKRFASAEEQQVIEETKARVSGLTANRTADSPTTRPSAAEAANHASPAPTTPPAAVEARSEHSKVQTGRDRARSLALAPTSALERAKREILEDVSAPPTPSSREAPVKSDGSRPLILPGFAGLEGGVSTLGNDLPDDIKVGSFTALNTDRHLYYSFYSRMEEAIRYRWETYVRAAFYEFENGQEKLGARERWVTRLEVILNRDGEFEKAIMSEGSGVSKFDRAPVQAFRDAAKFPNPPQEMLRDDGKIHVYYSFTIDIVPRYANRGA